MAQSKNVTPGHKPVKTSIPSDSLSATGRGAVTKGAGRTMNVRSSDLGQRRAGQCWAGDARKDRYESGGNSK
jgi:hypothetical protein